MCGTAVPGLGRFSMARRPVAEGLLARRSPDSPRSCRRAAGLDMGTGERQDRTSVSSGHRGPRPAAVSPQLVRRTLVGGRRPPTATNAVDAGQGRCRRRSCRSPIRRSMNIRKCVHHSRSCSPREVEPCGIGPRAPGGANVADGDRREQDSQCLPALRHRPGTPDSLRVHEQRRIHLGGRPRPLHLCESRRDDRELRPRVGRAEQPVRHQSAEVFPALPDPSSLPWRRRRRWGRTAPRRRAWPDDAAAPP
jgi:hypothetical protein